MNGALLLVGGACGAPSDYAATGAACARAEFLWAYDYTQHSWTPYNPTTGIFPGSRAGHVLVRESGASSSVAYMYGGTQGSESSSDAAVAYVGQLWILNWNSGAPSWSKCCSTCADTASALESGSSGNIEHECSLGSSGYETQ